jgi:hypothetical protein
MRKREIHDRVAMAIAQAVKITGPITARNAPLVKKIVRQLRVGSTGYQREGQQAP